ncbi:MAG: hypothetical protein UT05_C0004G0025 [Parcubacteria group bacterium GW2011_GWF2_38_76]|nr:MAG: hypothetical protein UT05_C0004G0025 [Parcubacteria group bacterium GW2011_GWF2_38_76]HBM45670.1 hypothetical protein [Patescibacteria group bacterium]
MKNNFPETNKKEVEKKTKKLSRELAETIREFCRSQKDLWQLVPNLALEADGRGGYLSLYSAAYTDGYWILNYCRPNQQYYRLAVDLLNGDIVCIMDEAPLASDEKIIKELLENIDEIDAGKIIAELEKDIQGRESNNTKEVKTWREKERRKLKLGKIYEKRNKKLKIEFSYD